MNQLQELILDILYHVEEDLHFEYSANSVQQRKLVNEAENYIADLDDDLLSEILGEQLQIGKDYIEFIPETKPAESLVYGVGINDAEYKVSPTVDGKKVTCPTYSTWKNMLAKCYREGNGNRGLTVTKEWHSFVCFRAWMLKQNWKGSRLTKDTNSTIFSPDTCRYTK